MQLFILSKLFAFTFVIFGVKIGLIMEQKEARKAGQQKKFRRFYQLFKSDLSLNEIERLIKRDVPGVYDFYRRDMEKPDDRRNALIRAATFSRNFFLAFLLKLTAARRLIYSIAIFLFIYALFTGMKWWQFIAFLMVNILLALEVADKLMARDELEVARDIQMGLMPAKPPSEIPFDVVCFSEPALEVGGDYYDFLIPENGRFSSYIVIGDVKGKGMAAALYMVRVQALLQHLINRHESPSAILVALNQNVRRILRNDFFISMAIAGIDRQGTFRLSRAGHMPFIHYRNLEKSCVSIQPRGMAVGLENGSLFEREIEEVSLKPAAGDVLLLFTDGLVETMNISRGQYNEGKLQDVIIKNAAGTAAEIRDGILKDLAGFRGAAAPHDDLTLIVIKIP